MKLERHDHAFDQQPPALSLQCAMKQQRVGRLIRAIKVTHPCNPSV